MSPDVTILIRHLAEIPPEFRQPVRFHNQKHGMHVPAIISDLLHTLSGDFKDPVLFTNFMPPEDKERINENYLRLCLFAAHILHHEYFRNKKGLAENIIPFLTGKLKEIAALAQADNFLTDADRREELVRHCIMLAGQPPTGETLNSARDRITTLDTVERQRVIQESYLAEKRARELREAIARREAEEAASKWSRE